MTLDAATHSYVPDDAGITLESLDFLVSPAGVKLRGEVLALFTEQPQPGVAAVAQLRKAYPTGSVHAALAMGKVQGRARTKFGLESAGTDWIWCVPEALEQATSRSVARKKAERFAALGVGAIADLCAGIGGDALALAGVAEVLAVDLSPVRLRCTELNAIFLKPPHRIRIQSAQVSSVLEGLPAETAIHIDPARRSAGKRSAAWRDLIPGPELLDRLRERFLAVGIKISSAVDFATLPTGHVELISEHRTVVQAMLWCGKFMEQLPAEQRTATILSTDQPPYSLTGIPRHVELDSRIATTLYEVDGAITRAGLAALFTEQHHLAALTVDGGYLTGEKAAIPATQAFTVIDSFPYSEKKVLEVLRAHAGSATAGPVEVKTRGGLDLDTDQLQRHWTQKAPVALTVLIYRDRQSQRRAILGCRNK